MTRTTRQGQPYYTDSRIWPSEGILPAFWHTFGLFPLGLLLTLMALVARPDAMTQAVFGLPAQTSFFAPAAVAAPSVTPFHLPDLSKFALGVFGEHPSAPGPGPAASPGVPAGATAKCTEAYVHASPAREVELSDLQRFVAELADLQAAGDITRAAQRDLSNAAAATAAQKLGCKLHLGRDGLVHGDDASVPLAAPAPLVGSLLQIAASFFSVQRVLAGLAVSLGVVGLTGVLQQLRVFEMLADLHPAVWETVGFSLAALVAIFSATLAPSLAPYVAAVPVLATPFLWALADAAYRAAVAPLQAESKYRLGTVWATLVALLLAVSARSPVLGFLALGGLLAAVSANWGTPRVLTWLYGEPTFGSSEWSLVAGGVLAAALAGARFVHPRAAAVGEQVLALPAAVLIVYPALLQAGMRATLGSYLAPGYLRHQAVFVGLCAVAYIASTVAGVPHLGDASVPALAFWLPTKIFELHLGYREMVSVGMLCVAALFFLGARFVIEYPAFAFPTYGSQ